jgi:DNA modification methylase
MAVADQVVTDSYAIYNGDCIEVLAEIPPKSVHLSVYSPPFAGLYSYSSADKDMSNCRDYDEFMKHYEFLVKEKARVTVPGRITAVHCADVPSGNTRNDHLRDFPGDIIRLHEQHGFLYIGRYCVWKDPFVVYVRTMTKSLQHKTCVEDSSKCSCASADYLLVFRLRGDNKTPIAHPRGLLNYAGSRQPPADILKYRGHKGKQTENKYSQWIWRQYASAFWDDVRLDRVLPYVKAKEADDERHVHPLQLDVIERAVILWSNPGDVVLTPFMGVGSEVYGAVVNGRRAIGVELTASYFRQAGLTVKAAAETGTRYDDNAQIVMGLADAPPADMGADE